MKKVISIFLSIMMLLSITAGMDFSAYALSSSGSCGDNVKYTYTNTNGIGVLTISGTGPMTNWSSSSSSPFYKQSGINYIIIKNSVTSIGDYAFYGCTGLTSITIPDSVTSIGDYAFYGCTGLTSITIPDSVTSIGSCAFYGCSGLKELKMPCSAKIYGSWSTFYNCTNIEKVTLTKGTGKMQDYDTSSSSSATNTYYQYTPWYISRNNFKELIIKDGVTSIGSSAFYGCTGLTSITIPDSVTSIGEEAFSGCTGLTSITIPDSVTSIGSSAFDGCTGLTSVTIPDSVTSIGSCAFDGCTGLTSVTIPDSVTSIGNSAFYGCTGLTRVNIRSIEAWCNILFGVNCANPLYYAHNLYLNGSLVSDLKIPDSVTSIGYSAFYGCTGLTSITIPDSVTSIGVSAFRDCTGLTSITIPDSVTSIGNSAFYGCTGLTRVNIRSIEAWCNILFGVDCANPLYYAHNLYLNGSLVSDLKIPDSVTSIGYSAFYGCTGLTSVTIPDSVTSIGSCAFDGCTGLTSVTIPGSVSSIGYYAFHGCSGLTSVTIPDSVTSIGSSAFNGCKGLTSITIPDSVTSIGSSAFNGCKGLTSITIPDSVSSIGVSAFYGCSGLKELKMPCSAKIYGSKDTFYNCTNIEKVTLTKGTGKMQDYDTSSSSSATNTYYQYTPWYISRNNIKELIIEDGVTSIGSCAFEGCTGLTSVTIPDSVTSIGEGAFADCTGLTSVTIPDSVTSIGVSAFYGCSGLKELKMPCSAKIYNSEHTFYNCTNIEKVTLTKGTGKMQDYGTSSSSSATNTYYQYTPWYISRNNFKELIIEDGVTSIGSSAFEGCTGLTSVTIPKSVTNIGNNAFSSLTEVTIPEASNFDFSGFDDCRNLTKINLSKSTGKMADWSVDYADSLWYKHRDTIREIELEEGIENISESAFYNCSNLIKTNIPSTVKTVGKYAYLGCSNLRNLTINSFDCTIPDSQNTVDPLATIYGYDYSTAQKYAEKYNRSFETLGKYICKTHSIVIDPAVKATCEKSGKTEGSHCSVCGEVIVPQKTINATGHKIVIDKAIPATFKAAGKTEGKHCSVCGKVLVTQKTIAKLGAPSLSKVTAGKKQFKAAWKAVKSIDGYQIQYSTNSSFKSGNKTVTVKGYKSTSKTVKSLKAKKKYYVRIRAYKTINGKKQYSSWSAKKTVTTKK